MSNAEKQAARRAAKTTPLDQEPSETTCGAPADFLAPAMPVHYSGNHSEHRTKLDELYNPFHYHVAVAEQLEMDEVNRTPAAKAATEKE